MSPLPDSGIVLHAIPYKDQNMVLRLFTREQGVLAAMMYRGRKTGELSVATTQPMSPVNLIWQNGKPRGLPVIRQMRFSRPVWNIHGDPVRSGICIFIAEFIMRALQEQHPEPALFDIASQYLDIIASENAVLGTIPLHFLGEAVHIFGLMPDFSEWPDEFSRLQIAEGRCYSHKNPYDEIIELSSGETQAFARLARFGETPTNREERHILLLAILRYLRHHHPGLFHMKSHEVLRELFSSIRMSP